MKPTDSPRCGYVAIIGRPNVGKSTLMNRLLDFKLSIVSPKPQTTRQRVLGIHNAPEGQIIFLDTPGLIKPKYKLQSAMMKIAGQAMEAADVLMVMADASSAEDPEFIEDLFQKRLKGTSLPAVLVLNKVDLVSKPELLPLMQRYHDMGFFREIIPVSALENDGVDRIHTILRKYLPEAEAFYPPDQLTEQPERFFVAEIIREKIFLNFSKEIPYSTEVMIEEFKERKKGKDFIRAVIIVERTSQRIILIGKKGAALKTIGEEARVSIEEFLGRKVFLELWVKVKEDWRQSDHALRQMGYL